MNSLLKGQRTPKCTQAHPEPGDDRHAEVTGSRAGGILNRLNYKALDELTRADTCLKSGTSLAVPWREYCRGAKAKSGSCRTISWFASGKVKYTVLTYGAEELC